MVCIYNEYISHLMYYWNIYIETSISHIIVFVDLTLTNVKNMSNFAHDYNITSNIKKCVSPANVYDKVS